MELKINNNEIIIDGKTYVLKEQQDWLKIPELSIEVELNVHDKGKSWDDLKLSEREDELLTTEECIFLANHTEYSKILKLDGSSIIDDFFIKQPFDINRKNDYVAWFWADSGGVSLSCSWYAQYSDAGLGVRYKRKLQ